jgi:hypothetical protein
LGTLSRLPAGSGTVCDLLVGFVRGTCCTIPGDAEDHDVGVVVVVDTLQGLGELENCVEGLLTELRDLLDAWGNLVDAAARACSSGISRGGSSVARAAGFARGIATPKIASRPKSKDDCS